MLVSALKRLGFSVTKPKASFYLYVAIPKSTKDGRDFASAEDFAEFLIRETLISAVPWDDAGAYVRFSVTFEAKDEADEVQIIEEIVRRLETIGFIF
jgi:LL-diaminopimelate aminotransferase